MNLLHSFLDCIDGGAIAFANLSSEMGNLATYFEPMIQ
jgi:hypothetical protein